MSFLGEQTLTRRRYANPSWGTGTGTAGATTDTSFRGSVQPMGGRDRQVLPEGLRERVGRKVYCPRGTLRTPDQIAGTPGDVVVDGSTLYTVVHVDNEHPLLEHDRAFVVRVQEGS